MLVTADWIRDRQLWARSLIQHTDWFQPTVGFSLRNSPSQSVFLLSPVCYEDRQKPKWLAVPSINFWCAPPLLPPATAEIRGYACTA